jgi:hypothetical protein
MHIKKLVQNKDFPSILKMYIHRGPPMYCITVRNAHGIFLVRGNFTNVRGHCYHLLSG